jgi:uncharacterized protein (UPF0303 family)
MGGAEEQLAVLRAQEQRLVFRSFDLDAAWGLGCLLRDTARADRLPVALSIRRDGQCLFHAALEGSTADNDAWLRRKAAVVEHFGHASYLVGCQFRARGGTFEEDSGLDAARFAAHGGAFPLLLAGTGPIGSVAVSGLPQVEDHRFVTSILERFLVESGLLAS